MNKCFIIMGMHSSATSLVAVRVKYLKTEEYYDAEAVDGKRKGEI